MFLALMCWGSDGIAGENKAGATFNETTIAWEGGKTEAAFFPAGNSRAVIFVPGMIFDKESWYDLAGRFQHAGAAALPLDGKTESDVSAAIAFLAEKGFKHIALVGGSMGGAAVISAINSAPLDKRVDTVVLLAPSGGKPIKNQHIRKLIITATSDSLGLYPFLRELYEKSAEPRQFKEFEGSAHAQHLFKGPHKDELARVIIDFIMDGK